MIASYRGLVRRHGSLLSFGLLLTFVSSWGQTFFISMFVPGMSSAAGLSAGRFALLYSAATLCAAALLPALGRALDRVPVRAYSFAVAAGLGASCAVAAAAHGWAALLFGLTGLRLAGAGLLSHVAATVVARGVARGRGTALGLSGLGHPLGEAVLPALALGLIGSIGWRAAWAAFAVLAALLLMPGAAFLSPSAGPAANRRGPSPGGTLSLARDSRFWLVLPGALVLPFVMTAAFLFQTALAEQRGWSDSWVAAGLAAFAASRTAAGLAGGPWIDAAGAARLFPFSAAPAALGLLILARSSSPSSLVLFLCLAGLSQGLGGTLHTAVWAELYPVERLGELRGASAAGVAAAAAAGPPLAGALLEAGWAYGDLLYSAAALIAAATAASAAGCRRALAERPLPEGT